MYIVCLMFSVVSAISVAGGGGGGGGVRVPRAYGDQCIDAQTIIASVSQEQTVTSARMPTP